MWTDGFDYEQFEALQDYLDAPATKQDRVAEAAAEMRAMETTAYLTDGQQVDADQIEMSDGDRERLAATLAYWASLRGGQGADQGEPL